MIKMVMGIGRKAHRDIRQGLFKLPDIAGPVTGVDGRWRKAEQFL